MKTVREEEEWISDRKKSGYKEGNPERWRPVNWSAKWRYSRVCESIQRTTTSTTMTTSTITTTTIYNVTIPPPHLATSNINATIDKSHQQLLVQCKRFRTLRKLSQRAMPLQTASPINERSMGEADEFVSLPCVHKRTAEGETDRPKNRPTEEPIDRHLQILFTGQC